MTEASPLNATGDGSADAVWTGKESASGGYPTLSAEQQLQLIDRVKSLEAQLGQSVGARALTPTEQLDAESLLLELRASLPWRVGRIVTRPVRVLQRLSGRIRRR